MRFWSCWADYILHIWSTLLLVTVKLKYFVISAEILLTSGMARLLVS